MTILGIDEVGRGPIAGPLFVGAVVLGDERLAWHNELRDSKKLSAKKREQLSKLIETEATFGIGKASAAEIDKIGIAEALRLATKRAVREIQSKRVPFHKIVIDGKVNFLANTALGKYTTTLVKADDIVKEVAAASIVAKTARDRLMVEMAKKYPQYGFEKNVGYGTAAHLKAVKDFGACEIHRKSFQPIKRMLGEEIKAQNLTQSNGERAENVASEYLKDKGHMILARNFRTERYEIDIVSFFRGTLFFTEVKYRKSDEYGGGMGAISREKLRKMRIGAGGWCKDAKERGFMPPKNIEQVQLAIAEVGGGNFKVKQWIPLDWKDSEI